jgi:hypothetical protein
MSHLIFGEIYLLIALFRMSPSSRETENHTNPLIFDIFGNARSNPHRYNTSQINFFVDV